MEIVQHTDEEEDEEEDVLASLDEEERARMAEFAEEQRRELHRRLGGSLLAEPSPSLLAKREQVKRLHESVNERLAASASARGAKTPTDAQLRAQAEALERAKA